MADPAISVRNLTKDFEVYDRPIDVAWELITRIPRHRSFRALDDVSFEVGRGEVLGVIGANGAGKSTLLKIITGVLDVTSGSVEINGRVTAILELGLGFNIEQSGRENIHLSGLLYGMTRREIDAKLASIIDFSGLGDFIERPVKTYSSGMMARLAFAIATAGDPDILIIDEALAAGDAMFVQKCLRRIRQICSSGSTVLLVSHGTGLLAQLCQRVIWLDKGRLREFGPALSVVQAYDLAAHAGVDSTGWIEEVELASLPGAPAGSTAEKSAAEGGPVADPDEPTSAMSAASATPLSPQATAFAGALDLTADTSLKVLRRGPFAIDDVQLLDNRGQPARRFLSLTRFVIRIAYHCDGPVPDESLGIALAINRAGDLAPVSQWFTQNILPFETREMYDQAPFRLKPKAKGVIDLEYVSLPLSGGDYILSIGLLANKPANWEFYEYRHLAYRFSVDDGGSGIGAPTFQVPTLIRHTGAAVAADHPPAPYPDPVGLIGKEPLTIREEIVKTCILDHHYPDGWPTHPACPCCAGTRTSPAFSKYGFSHKSCDACGFVFVDPYPSEDVVRALYAGPYYTRTREFIEAPRLRNGEEATAFSFPRDVLVGAIRRAFAGRQTGSWLEVGGGVGAFAGLIREMLPGWAVTLNEFNPRSLELAHDIVGVETTSNSAEELLRSGRRFDVISSVAVLEHIADPASFVAGYARLLAPGGVLVTIIPQFTRLNALVSQAASANAVPPFHLSLFNRDNIKVLMRRAHDFARIEVDESGPAAFSLIEHIPYGDDWDVAMPSAEAPVAQGVQIKPYSAETSARLNALHTANVEMGDYFAETDGRLNLTVMCWL